MIYDCFIFNNELDLLELRLATLYDVVDRFVLVEANQTFMGEPKPLYYQENESRFEAFKDKIGSIALIDHFSRLAPGVFDTTPCHQNERHQRDSIAWGLANSKPDDTVWLSDLDEIPPPEGAEWEPDPLFVFNAKIYIYFMNYRLHKDSGATCAVKRSYLDAKTPNEVMLARSWGPFRQGGWHFSYMGGASNISAKLQAICHQEYNKPEIVDVNNIKRTIGSGGSIFALPGQRDYAEYGWEWPEDGKLIHLEGLDDLPDYVKDNPGKFEKYIASDIESDVWGEKFM